MYKGRTKGNAVQVLLLQFSQGGGYSYSMVRPEAQPSAGYYDHIAGCTLVV